jgi:hypothetical protein
VGKRVSPPGLPNDYIHLATVSIAMGLAIGIGTVIIEEFSLMIRLMEEM